jgi:triosephosphate isomerase
MPQSHLIAANWKMNGLKSSIPMARAIAEASRNYNAQVAIFPPFTLLPLLAQALEGTGVILGGQNCHYAEGGAYTSGISASMLKDAGARYVLLGHSERRQGLAESCMLIARKAVAAIKGGLEPIICIGETADERDAGLTVPVLERHLKDSLPDELKGHLFHIAYEPVWAIGSGKTATDGQILEAFDQISDHLGARFGPMPDAHLLYGGSVNAANARQILSLEGISGALVGGASLKAETFMPIVEAASLAHA